MIYLGSDHIGFSCKEEIEQYLLTKGYRVEDLGPETAEYVDFPGYALKVARKVAGDLNHRGILFSGTGQGMCIAANKIKHIYAALVYNEKLAEKARTENATNVLCLPTEFLSHDSAKNIVAAWLSASFSGAEHSVRHLQMIKEIEDRGAL